MKPTITLRKCVEGDEALLSILGPATFWEAFADNLCGSDLVEHCRRQHSEEKYRTWLRDPRSHLWVAELESGPTAVGYLLLTTPDLPLPDIDAYDFEIKRVYLLHRFQQFGIGRRLMDAARLYAERLGARRLLLGVYEQNHSAIAFYRHLGYEPIGTRAFQVGTTVCEDLILGLTLKE